MTRPLTRHRSPSSLPVGFAVILIAGALGLAALNLFLGAIK
tara:strand:- start:3790 stop:3912 length:123 start_codon:yes stop_codon:yes gene_type:complete